MDGELDLHFTSAAHSVKGEDRMLVYASDDRIVCCIADGHGGVAAAQLCIDYLSRTHLHTMEHVPDSEWKALYHSMHARVQQLSTRSGATLTCCVVHASSGSYVCVNVGDSECIHVTPTSHMRVTVSHRLQENAAERKLHGQNINFVSVGGIASGPPRLFPGGTACTRSIGDADCPHMSHCPFVMRGKLGRSDNLIIASDGLWDTLSLRAIAKAARSGRSAKYFVDKCKHNTRDDVSVVVVGQRLARPSSFSLNLSNLFYSGSSSSPSSSSDEGAERGDDTQTRTVVQVACSN